MTEQCPKKEDIQSAKEAFIHILCRVEDMQEVVGEIHKMQREMGAEHRWFHLLGAALKWGGVIGSQVSTLFIAGYVALEHTWYVTKIVHFLTRIFGG